MHVLRVVRVLLVVLIVAAVVGAGSSVLSARPDLDTAKRNVDTAWTAVAAQLDARYLQLAALAQHLSAVAGPVHSVAHDADAALAHWRDVRQHGSVAAQVAAANEVEAMARELLATQAASPRVRGNTTLLNDVDHFLAQSTGTAASDFNRAVQSYEHERSGPVRAVVAGVLGDRSIPTLDDTQIREGGGPASS
jgi:hypothetical protein